MPRSDEYPLDPVNLQPGAPERIGDPLRECSIPVLNGPVEGVDGDDALGHALTANVENHAVVPKEILVVLNRNAVQTQSI